MLIKRRVGSVSSRTKEFLRPLLDCSVEVRSKCVAVLEPKQAEKFQALVPCGILAFSRE